MVTLLCGIPTLADMDGSVRVLLVSAGASPDALVTELERLGVEITPCSFADAEEHLETDPPDLVALAGALGAVELANMIDDLEDGPRMVIVAERKELAKLRGLNREVVVSLFAMETTEKVVGQRIESLARRAARRRDQKSAEPAPANKTSMGLPMAAHVGTLEVKRGEPPPRSRGPAVSDQGPDSPGAKEGVQTELLPTKEKPLPKAETAEVRPEPPRRKPPSALKDEPAPKGLPLPSGAHTPTPSKEGQLLSRSAREEAEQSIMVIDEDLLESIRPDPPDGPIPEISVLSLISVVPDPEDAPVSHPPTLPPAAKAQSSRARDFNLSASPGELDIGDAESALENLDSPNLEITQDLVLHAQKEMGSSKPELPADEGVSLGGEKAAPEMSSSSDEPVRATGGETPDPKIAVSPDEKVSHEKVSAKEPPASSVNEGLGRPDKVAHGVATERKKGGGKAFGLIAAAGVLFGGVYAVSSGKLGGSAKGNAGDAATVTDSPEAAPLRAAPADIAGENASPGEELQQLQQEDDAAQLDEQAPENEVSTPDEQAPVEEGPPAPRSRESALENPFEREEADAPTCDELLGSAAPVEVADPISKASAAWDKARAAIVGGKLVDAHKYMCEAVSINPESAALEGLASTYLNMGAYSEALRWANKADSLRPGQMDIGNLKGDVYAMMGDVEKARDTWLNLLNIGPDQMSRVGPISKDYSVEAGRHMRRGDLVRAEIFYRRAVILDPENQSGLIGLAKVYHRLEMPAYARAFGEMSLKLSDVIPEVHVLLGELALAEGRQEEARRRFERALAVRPDFFPAKRGLSQVK